MAWISSVNETKNTLLKLPVEAIQYYEKYSIRGSSSIHSLKAPVCLTSIITLPFRIVKKFMNGIISLLKFVCCCGKKDKIDWKNTEKILADIIAKAINSTEPFLSRQKAFNELILKLEEDCPPAMNRFKEHIAFAHAEKTERIRGRAEQEKWAATNENSKKVAFKDVLNSVENPILQKAVRSFNAEIRQKGPQS